MPTYTIDELEADVYRNVGNSGPVIDAAKERLQEMRAERDSRSAIKNAHTLSEACEKAVYKDARGRWSWKLLEGPNGETLNGTYWWAHKQCAIRDAVSVWTGICNKTIVVDPEALTIEDYQQAFADHRRLVRELDVLLNGQAGAAKQASLCDIVGQIKSARQPRWWEIWP